VGNRAISSLDYLEKSLLPLESFIALVSSFEGLTWALGALRLSSMAMVAKRIICTVAPLAYQNGPDTPYLYDTAEDCSKVAAQVHDETALGLALVLFSML